MLLPSGPPSMFRSTNCSRVSGDLPLYDLLPLPLDPGEGAARIQKAAAVVAACLLQLKET